jgi:hypothetical protein
MERGEELMELNREAADRNTRAFERVMATLDRHERLFERSEKMFARSERAFERSERAFERSEKVFARHQHLFEEQRADKDDLKIFIREMTVRAEKRDREWRQHNEEVQAREAARTDAIVAEMKEARDESRAFREALLVLIDRLPPPAQAA